MVKDCYSPLGGYSRLLPQGVEGWAMGPGVGGGEEGLRVNVSYGSPVSVEG